MRLRHIEYCNRKMLVLSLLSSSPPTKIQNVLMKGRRAQNVTMLRTFHFDNGNLTRITLPLIDMAQAPVWNRSVARLVGVRWNFLQQIPIYLIPCTLDRFVIWRSDRRQRRRWCLGGNQGNKALNDLLNMIKCR